MVADILLSTSRRNLDFLRWVQKTPQGVVLTRVIFGTGMVFVGGTGTPLGPCQCLEGAAESSLSVDSFIAVDFQRLP